MSRLHSFLIILTLAFWPNHAFSQSTQEWVVAKLNGVAYIASKEDAGSKVHVGMTLLPGQTLSTQSRSRILLKRGAERIQVGPNAIIALPPAKYSRSGKTLILQQSGRIQLTVNKQARQHFTVKTPYLSAVVKGTVFTVEVGQSRSNVTVNRGQVQVSNHATGETVQVRRGQAAAVQVNAKGVSRMTTKAAGKPMPVTVIKRNKAKAGFYATVTKGGKKYALRAGSTKKTISVDKAKQQATSKGNNSSNSNAGNSSNNGNNGNSGSKSNNGNSSNTSNNGNSSNASNNGNSSNASNNGNSSSKSSNGNSSDKSNNGKSGDKSNNGKKK